MAIVKELYKTKKDGVKLYKTYSDEGYMIKKVGTDELYEEAIDVEDANYSYVETEEYIEINTPSVDLEELELKSKAYDILVGEVK